MNPRLCLLIVFLLLGTVMLPAANANAQATRIEFTGTELCDMDTLMAERLWNAGPNFMVRNWTQTCYETANIPEMTGTTYLYNALANIGRNYIVNAKFRLETIEGGIWVGICEWPANTNFIKCIGYGEGIYEGLELHWSPGPNFGLPTPFYGYIINPGQ